VRYSELLRDSHVAVLDLATMVHGMRPSYGMDMFPRGGIHWNALAAANAARAVIDAINAQAGRETLRPFDLTYHLSGDLDLLDHELESGLNLLFEHIHDREPRVVFSAAGTCDQHGARQLTAPAVGGSFLGSLGEVLTAQGCLVQLQHYFYTRGSLYAFQPSRLVKPSLTDADLAPLRTVDILLVEENESLIGRSVHFEQLYEVLAQPEHRPNQPARP